MSLPAAPASERKHGVCATSFIGSLLASTMLSRTRLVAGHFGGGDQVEALLALHAEQIRFELRQLARALQRGRADEIRHVQLGVAVLARVQVEHELRQRAMQARNAAAHDREARAGNLRGGFEIEAAELLAELDVILRREVELARLAASAHFDVGGFVAAVGHGLVQRVGQA